MAGWAAADGSINILGFLVGFLHYQIGSPSPNAYSASEYGKSSAVFTSMYLEVLGIPMITGSIGILAAAYSSLIFMARHQKCDWGPYKNQKPYQKSKNVD